jgi:hypothetical protein
MLNLIESVEEMEVDDRYGDEDEHPFTGDLGYHDHSHPIYMDDQESHLEEPVPQAITRQNDNGKDDENDSLEEFRGVIRDVMSSEDGEDRAEESVPESAIAEFDRAEQLGYQPPPPPPSHLVGDIRVPVVSFKQAKTRYRFRERSFRRHLVNSARARFCPVRALDPTNDNVKAVGRFMLQICREKGVSAAAQARMLPYCVEMVFIPSKDHIQASRMASTRAAQKLVEAAKKKYYSPYNKIMNWFFGDGVSEHTAAAHISRD